MEEISMKAEPAAEGGAHVPVEATVEAGKTYWWCACGLSKQQPFCDGSHKTTQIVPLRYKATENGTKWFCVCKRTKTAPFCDGSHAECTP